MAKINYVENQIREHIIFWPCTALRFFCPLFLVQMVQKLARISLIMLVPLQGNNAVELACPVLRPN